MTSSPHGLYVQGYTRATMGGTKRCKPARGSQSQKTALSSDCSLQLGCMKLESLVIADQHAAVNTSRASYTPPVTSRKQVALEAGSLTARRQPSKVWLVIGVKS